MTNAESAQENLHTIITVYGDHLSNATSDYFFCLPNEKNLSKTTTEKLDPAKKWETNIMQQCIKNKRLYDYIYSSATLKCKVCLAYQIWTFYKII